MDPKPLKFSTKTPQEKQHIINVDAIDRDIVKYPNSNTFKFDLKSTYKNVKSIELMTAEIPNTDFVVNEYNNKFEFTELGTTYSITIDVGDYDENELANEIRDLMNNAGSPNTYVVAFEHGKYTFIADINEFTLLFATGTSADQIVTSTGDGYNRSYINFGTSARRLLGFNIANVTSSALNTTSPNKINLNGEKYIVLELGQDIREELDSYSSTNHSAFGKIIMTCSLNSVQLYTEDLYQIRKDYKEPIQKLSHLDVKFRKRDGNLYNFRGHDPSFMLRIITLE